MKGIWEKIRSRPNGKWKELENWGTRETKGTWATTGAWGTRET